MEEKFYEEIKAILNNPPEFPYKEARWKVLEKRLNQKSNFNIKSCWLKTCCLFFFKRNSN